MNMFPAKLLGKKQDDTGIVPTRLRKSSKTNSVTAICKTVGFMYILEWIGRESEINDDLLSSEDKGTAQKVLSIARFWMTKSDKTIRRIKAWQISHVLLYWEGLSEDVAMS